MTKREKAEEERTHIWDNFTQIMRNVAANCFYDNMLFSFTLICNINNMLSNKNPSPPNAEQFQKA